MTWKVKFYEQKQEMLINNFKRKFYVRRATRTMGPYLFRNFQNLIQTKLSLKQKINNQFIKIRDLLPRKANIQVLIKQKTNKVTNFHSLKNTIILINLKS